MSSSKASKPKPVRTGAFWAAAVQTSAPLLTSTAQHVENPELQRFVRSIATDSPPWAPEVVDWLRCGFAEFETSGWKTPLQKCLGLAGSRGHRKFQTRARYAERDRWIAGACDECGRGDSAWQEAHNVLDEIDRFEELYWRPWKDAGRPEESRPDKGATPLRVALFNAFKATDGEIPRHWRQIKELVKRSRASCGTTG